MLKIVTSLGCSPLAARLQLGSRPSALRRGTLGVALTLAALALGCSEDPSPADGAGGAGGAGDECHCEEEAALSVVFGPEAEELALGENTLEFSVFDAEEQPVEGAEVDVHVSMSAHGHGTATPPEVVELGEGRYRIEELMLSMAGSWEIHLHVHASEASGEALLEVDVR